MTEVTEAELVMLILLAGAAWVFVAWVAYDLGYDRGWHDGRYPKRRGDE